jgi:hypothetical protein
MRQGILAGVVKGRRRVGLGPTWDSRYHRYLDATNGELWRYRPSLRIAGPAPDQEASAPDGVETLRKAS